MQEAHKPCTNDSKKFLKIKSHLVHYSLCRPSKTFNKLASTLTTLLEGFVVAKVAHDTHEVIVAVYFEAAASIEQPLRLLEVLVVWSKRTGLSQTAASSTLWMPTPKPPPT